jgi:hypothetical protein
MLIGTLGTITYLLLTVIVLAALTGIAISAPRIPTETIDQSRRHFQLGPASCDGLSRALDPAAKPRSQRKSDFSGRRGCHASHLHG